MLSCVSGTVICKRCEPNGHWKFITVKANKATKTNHSALVVQTHWPGFYEGSIFYGCRFDDFDTVDSFLEQPNFRDDLVKADPFVSETLGYILHNNRGYYKTLYRIKNRRTAEKYKFKGIPYFVEYGSHIISQFKMSSGECLLISLIDFINNLIIKGGRFNKFLFLIDEVELALHPGAIDRLVLFVNDLIATSKYELVFYFSTHSGSQYSRWCWVWRTRTAGKALAWYCNKVCYRYWEIWFDCKVTAVCPSLPGLWYGCKGRKQARLSSCFCS